MVKLHTLLVAASLLGASFSALAGLESDGSNSIKRKFDLYSFNPSEVKEEKRSDSIRLLLNERELAKGDEWRIVDGYLIMLGHVETIKRHAEMLRRGDLRSALVEGATEECIPYLIDIVVTGATLDPGFASNDSDVYEYSPCSNAIRSILMTVKLSTAFPAGSRRWASDLMKEKNLSTGQRRQILDSWWEHNKAAIAQKRYAEARWLPSYKEKRPVPNARKPKEGNGAFESGDGAENARRDDGGPISGQRSSGRWWVALSAAAAALVALLAWLFLRRRKA